MINLAQIYLQYGERVIFNSVNLTIKERDRIGLVGRNGAGKSTLLKIIAGELKPDDGAVSLPADVTIGYLHQDMFLPKGKTVIEEALSAFDEIRRIEEALEQVNRQVSTRTDYESEAFMDLLHRQAELLERFEVLGGTTIQADAIRVLTGLGFKADQLERLTETFSGGWQMRIELAKMLLSKPDYLLLDEPTNHLDIESIIWLEEFLQTYPGAVVIISHDKQFLDNTTKRTVEIELGKIHDYKANYSQYLVQRAERRALLLNAYENQQRVLADKQRTIDRFMAKATKTSMAQSMQKQLDKIERIELDEEDTAVMNLRFPPAPRSGQIITEARRLSKQYGSLVVLNNLDLKIDRGDRIAFVGQNGQGKTTLAKILVGIEPATSGEVVLGHNCQIGYYAQNQAEALQGHLTLLQTMEQHSPPEMRPKLRHVLGAFMFSGDDADKKVSVLSGGERARLALACLLLNPFNLLVLDEPTNHLDIKSKEVLKHALMNYDGTLIVVSHDRDFLSGLTTKTIEFRNGHLYEYLGDVNYFLSKRRLDNMRDAGLKTIPSNQEPMRMSVEQRREYDKQLKRLQKQLETAEADIAGLEAELKQIELSMGEHGFYESAGAQQVLELYDRKQKQLEEAMSRWETAQLAIDAMPATSD